MSRESRYSTVSPVDIASRRSSEDTFNDEGGESLELERVHRDDGSEVGLTAPSSYAPKSSTAYSKSFKTNEQTRKLFFPQFWRWIGTVALIGLMLATLKIFQHMGNFSNNRKHVFNTIITALSLGLGINFLEAFKDIAKILRWPILASRPHSVREVDLILSIESLFKVAELAWVCRRRWLTVLACFSWLALNLLAQVVVAIVGLDYSADSGFDYHGTVLQHGIVNATNLTCFSDNGACPDQPMVEQIQAHLFGQIGSGAQCRTYIDFSEVLTSDANPLYWCRQPPHYPLENTLRFTEINDRDPIRIYPYLTNRTITAASGTCFKYDIDEDSGTMTDNLLGNLAAMNWKYSNGTVNGSITIPTAFMNTDSTTYIYNGTKIPQDEVESSCGPRCMWMLAFKGLSTLPADQRQSMALYQCPITVGPVKNATIDSQMISDGMAKLAASAIALEGRYAQVEENGPQIWRQYQMYPWGSAWEIHQKTAEQVGANMASYALSSLAWMATHNPTFSYEGLTPVLGYNLSVHWSYVIEIAVTIVVVHFVFFMVAIYLSRLVVIKDDTFLSAARLLRPLMEHLGSKATLLDGKELSEAIQKFVPNGIVYGPREDHEQHGVVLDIGEDIKPRKRLPTRRHPDGDYL